MSVAKLISKKLSFSIENNGMASLVISGGSSPLKVFEELSNIDIPWPKVKVTLVDDRLVDYNNKFSNH
jgi:6-phosphogluconolactonase